MQPSTRKIADVNHKIRGATPFGCAIMEYHIMSFIKPSFSSQMVIFRHL